eukprot:366296-Chlamydomonas_euryale.AAC.21
MGFSSRGAAHPGHPACPMHRGGLSILEGHGKGRVRSQRAREARGARGARDARGARGAWCLGRSVELRFVYLWRRVHKRVGVGGEVLHMGLDWGWWDAWRPVHGCMRTFGRTCGGGIGGPVGFPPGSIAMSAADPHSDVGTLPFDSAAVCCSRSPAALGCSMPHRRRSVTVLAATPSVVLPLAPSSPRRRTSARAVTSVGDGPPAPVPAVCTSQLSVLVVVPSKSW